ncbi:MAG: Succinyl-CoA ligase (ADP-forming) subunit beta [Syntrophorhabdus sp. PtaU1.Bin153]|nr:MAG: Succinyl-CoA ligase (ADP-forming) subunit beta [Syntrophorhabdus sp. PtaU1.Bin153]
MKIHEYQAKALFKAYGIPIPRSALAQTPAEAAKAAHELGTSPLVVKAQIHAGGRGKGGGIRVIGTPAEAEMVASQLLGTRLVTPQTGEEGRPVETLLIEEALTIVTEVYLGITIDRSRSCPVVLASKGGGMEVEKFAAEEPHKVMIEEIDPAVGLRPFQASRICYDLNLQASAVRKISGLIFALYQLFIEKDCSLAEINPLVMTGMGDPVALDAKLNFDDNALFRHPEIIALRDISQENPLEVEASRYNLNYIKLKGNVGCMVNGAGLAMATMDLIKRAGAEPANFLDIGGGATAETVREGFKLLLADRDVQVIFINIFGGILRCDTLARGVVKAAAELVVDLPMVVRLEGTNVEKGRQILSDSGLKFTVASGLKDAAEKVVAGLSSR